MLWALLGTLALTLTFVGIVTVVLVDRSLRNRLAGEAVAITEFNLAVLAPAAGVSAGATPEEVAESGILDRFLDRGPTGVWVEFAGGERVSAGDTRVDVAAGLEQIARSGEIGYQFTEDPGGLALVTAARMPPDGPLYYFVTPATLVVETTRQVALVAAGAGLVALVAGGLLAGGSSRRMLAPVAAEVTVIHRRDQFRAHAASVREMREAAARGEESVRTPYEVREIEGEGGCVRAATIFDNDTDEDERLEVDAVIALLGFKPDLGPIKSWGLTVNKNRIVVNQLMETNVPGVFAAGDIAAVAVKMNLIATCYGQAALAVNVAKNYIDPRASIFPGHSSEKMGQ